MNDIIETHHKSSLGPRPHIENEDTGPLQLRIVVPQSFPRPLQPCGEVSCGGRGLPASALIQTSHIY